MDLQGVIGNYVLERELGRGGMGVVYAATHRVLGRPAAIKVLLASTLEHRDRVERFFNEARAAMAIDHPGIVKTYDVGVDHGGRAYIAMELLDGGSLASRLRQGPLPLRLAVQFARQIAEALAAAHRAGIVHRDLKPENIIVTSGEQLKLVDFGIAKLAQPATVRTATGVMMGTPLYMSPEQCEGAREVDARTDLYSLGCVMFAMLTGRPPFESAGSGGVIGQHLHVPAPLLRTRCPAASQALEGIVRCLLAKSRDERFRTASIVATALAAPEVIALSGPSEVAATADLVPPTRPAWTPIGTQPTHATGFPPPGAGLSPPAWSPVQQSVATPTPYPPPPYPAPGSNLARPAWSPSGPGASTSSPHASVATAQPGRRRSTIAILAGSCIATAVLAIVLTRSCMSNDAATPPPIVATVEPDAARQLDPIAVVPVDAAVVVLAPDAAPTVTTEDGRGGRPKARPSSRTTTAKRPPESTGPVASAGSASSPEPVPEQEPAPEPARPRVAIRERLVFGKGDFSAGSNAAALDRIAAAHRADPTRIIHVVGHAEQDESRTLESLALARANAVLTHLTSRRVARDVIKLSPAHIDPVTSDGSNRRADVTFAP